jgi:FMN phosphatase YigB (HAD superfamily)
MALKKTELTPEEVVMIGDSFEDDMMGAVQMGIQSYHLKSIFGEKKITESNDRSAVIKEFYNLIHLLEHLSI